MLKAAIFGAVLAIAATPYFAHHFVSNKLPVEDRWWGAGERRDEPGDVTEFRVPFDQAVVDDLRTRLRNRREGAWMDEVADQWVRGVNRSFLQHALQHWAENYDWAKAVEKINAFPQYTTQLDGISVHFWHFAARGVERPTILLIHGWPGSVYEFHKVAPILSESFNVVVPSLPGYAWSSAPARPGMSPVQIAHLFHKLMARLGYSTYYVQGGDWGSLVAQGLALTHPDAVRGVHLNFYPLTSIFALARYPLLVFNPSEMSKVPSLTNLVRSTGYLHLQATKPHTIGAALSDTPAGLAAYILEKFAAWTDCCDAERVVCDPTKAVHLDDMLTNLMIYWTTNSFASSTHLYYDAFANPDITRFSMAPIHLPVGLLEMPIELFRTPLFVARSKFTSIVSHTAAPRGGHFAALEQPEIFVNDVMKFMEAAGATGEAE